MKNERMRRNAGHNCRGTVAVEFALIFPVVITIFLGLIVLTQIVMLRDTMQHAAYEGARRGLTLVSTSPDVIAETENFLSKFGVQGAQITVDPPTLTPTAEAVTVTVEVPIDENTWADFLPVNAGIRRSVTLRRKFAL